MRLALANARRKSQHAALKANVARKGRNVVRENEQMVVVLQPLFSLFSPEHILYNDGTANYTILP